MPEYTPDGTYESLKKRFEIIQRTDTIQDPPGIDVALPPVYSPGCNTLQAGT